MALLSRNQAQFAARLAARTGLNPRLVGAWIIAEEPAGANVPVGHNDQNWLNIGNTDTKWYGGASAWKNPVAAADKSAAWLQGKYSVPGFGRAASGIVSFSRTAGQPIGQQIGALQRSGWASSGYPDLPGLVGQVSGKLGLRPYMQAERQGMAPAPASSQGGKALTLNTGPQYRTSQQQVFDQAGYERAQRAYALGQFLQNQPRSPFDALTRGGVAKPSNPLLSVLPQAAPSPVDYTDSVTRLQRIAGEKVRIATPKINGKIPSSPGPTAALQFASQRVGTKETSTNAGPKISDWISSFGLTPGPASPWCGVFVGKALQAAGVRGIDQRVASVQSIRDMAAAGEGGFSKLVGPRDVKPGDVIGWGSDHTGIVSKVNRDGTFSTIEGNSSDAVSKRIHPSAGAWFARPAYPSRKR